LVRLLRLLGGGSNAAPQPAQTEMGRLKRVLKHRGVDVTWCSEKQVRASSATSMALGNIHALLCSASATVSDKQLRDAEQQTIV
jgi:hypothetical protein